MNLIQLQKGQKAYGTKILFDQAQFSINEGEHVGVIGPNGAGKTTLFRILVDQESLDEGEIVRSRQLRIGYLQQESREPDDLVTGTYIEQSATIPMWELKQLGEGLGLQQKHYEMTFPQLSGGYRMRMKLLALIGQQPNLMLLDEPTNFLDLESVLVLEKFLQGYKGAFLLISHDREFLRRTTDHTLEVEAGEITKYPGTIDDYFEQKQQLRVILEAQALSQDSKRKRVEEFVSRFGAKATKARQAQSRLKQLDKMEKVELKALPQRAKINIPDPITTGKETLALRDGDLGYEDRVIVGNCSLRLERGDHLGVVGFNGAGKSTLLKSIAGRIPLLNGRLNFGYNVSYSYYAQHVAEELDPKLTVIESLEAGAHSDVKTQDILNLAGSLLFSGDAIQKRIHVLSGGEKSRVALGRMLLQRSPLLILDEPTNHLDFDTVEALTEALRNYPGTVIAVSHDRGFIGRMATKILEIRDGRAEIYPGSYDDYLWSLEKGALKERYSKDNNLSSYAEYSPDINLESVLVPPQSNDDTRTNHKHEVKRLRSKIAEYRRQIAQDEKLLMQATQKLEELNNHILAAQGVEAADLARELGQCGQTIEQLENQILSSMELLAQAEQKLQ